jgi:hypothetical protein
MGIPMNRKRKLMQGIATGYYRPGLKTQNLPDEHEVWSATILDFYRAGSIDSGFL